MATRKYKPYTTRRQQTSRRMRNIGLTLIVLIVAVVIFKKVNKGNESTLEQANGSEATPGSAMSGTSESTTDLGPVEVITTTLAPDEPTSPAEPPLQPVEEEPAPKPVIETPAAAGHQDDESSPRAKASVEEALKLRDAGKIIEARELLNDTLNEKLSPNLRSAVKLQLNKLAEKWLFSDEVLGGDKLSSTYLVQRGDHLERIAKQYKIPYELLQRINGIKRPELLRAGQQIKVIHGPFNVIVYKSNFTMDLYLQDKYVKTYRVGLGKEQHETPSGRWRVQSDGKLANKPSWPSPDGRMIDASNPEYPLGERYIAIEGIDEETRKRNGFAIHGTKDPETIGTRSSLGCIRLFNGDVVEVYNMLYAGVSEVHVVD